MNKKGFTLIEMLAVIVLLGLLMGILFPVVSRYIIDTKNNTYKMYEADMKASAKNLMNDCVERNDTICIPKANKYKAVTLSELVSTGYSEKLRDPKDDSKDCDPFNSFVLIHNEGPNITNLTYDVCLICGSYSTGNCEGLKRQIPELNPDCTAEMDKDPPVCGVTQGESKIWSNKDRIVTIGCSDTCTGCVQDTFTKKFTENGRKGTITISDNAGKTQDCEVDIYIDKTKPTCTLKIDGTIGENDWYKANPRPKVKLETKDDTISGVATYGMGTSKSNYDFNKEIEYEVPDGITTVYGYVKDNAGNVGTCYVEVQYDPTPPVIKSVDYGTDVYGTGDNSKPDLLKTKSGSTITLTNITSEYGSIYGVYVYMASGKGGTVTVKNGSTNIMTMTVPASTSKARNYFETPASYNNLSFVFASETQVNNVVRIELLTRDDTVGYYTNKDVNLYINASDSVSGRGQYSFDDGTHWQDNNDNLYKKLQTVNMKTKDYSGNVSETTTKKITNIDKVNPGCSIKLGSSTVVEHENHYFWTDVPIKLNKDDKDGSPNYATSGTRNYGLKSSNGLEYNGEDSGKQTADANGHAWYGYVRDNAGNLSDCSEKVYKDTVNPSCKLKKSGTEGADGWFRSNVTFEFEKKQDNESTNGVKSGLVYYQIDKSSSDPDTWEKEDSDVQKTDTDEITWYGHVKDKSGRTGKCTIKVKRDTVPPTCSISSSGKVGDNNWYVGNVSISLTYDDERSGSYDWGIDDYNKKTSLSHTEDTKSRKYVGKIKDKAGNESTCSGTIKKDTVAPTCGATTTTNNSSSGVTGNVTCSDSTAGCAITSVPFSTLTANTGVGNADPRVEYSNVIDVKSHGSYDIKDKAGHVTKCYVKIDSYCQFANKAHSECGSYYDKYSTMCGRTWIDSPYCDSGYTLSGASCVKTTSSLDCFTPDPPWNTSSKCDELEFGEGQWINGQCCRTVTNTSYGTYYSGYYNYGWSGGGTTNYNTSCDNNHISCDSTTYGSYYVNCTWTGYQTCRTKGNLCETYLYKYDSVTETPSTNGGSNGVATCSSGGAFVGAAMLCN